jgi:hypothetical protein
MNKLTTFFLYVCFTDVCLFVLFLSCRIYKLVVIVSAILIYLLVCHNFLQKCRGFGVLAGCYVGTV